MTVLLRSWSNKTTLLNKRVEAMKQVSVFVLSLSNGDESCFTLISCSFSTRKRLRCWTRWRDTGRAPRWSWASSRKTGKYGNCSKKTKVLGGFAIKSCRWMSFEGYFKSKSTHFSQQSCAHHWRSISLLWSSSWANTESRCFAFWWPARETILLLSPSSENSTLMSVLQTVFMRFPLILVSK